MSRSSNRWMMVCCLMWASAVSAASYDSDPHHLWNRLNDTLFTRIAPGGEHYGLDEVDILFWRNTLHLLTSPSREAAIRVLDEFIRHHGERQVRDPVKRALLQRDLWALFDWSAVPPWPEEDPAEALARRELQRRVVTVMKRIALSAEEIASLPDNYADATARFSDSQIPKGLFATDGDWLLIGNGREVTAIDHAYGFEGRSVFLVFAKFPGGREQAKQYLGVLGAFVPALIYPDPSQLTGPESERRTMRVNPKTPQFPAGTRWALVRKLCLIDDHGQLRATRMIETLQTRTYSSIPDMDASLDVLRGAQQFAEFQLDRAHASALRAVAEDEKDFQFVHYRSMGYDPFERQTPADWAKNLPFVRGETLRTCGTCHVHQGILSVNTYTMFNTAAQRLDSSTLEVETGRDLAWKTRRFDWGLLQGLWQQQ